MVESISARYGSWNEVTLLLGKSMENRPETSSRVKEQRSGASGCGTSLIEVSTAGAEDETAGKDSRGDAEREN